jgi:DNA-binding Xre family transcriptional regulator
MRRWSNESSEPKMERFRCSGQQISLLESQGNNITIGTFDKIATALDSEVEVDLVAAG